ncbi:unnamed protein product [Ceratitis capitata]|uniref:(Mediterranean fruit fly) hypothetical protein n=1 Tax=Ceratitis capitata TaxID=7213 RepID=A0A811U1Y5_CERCA|nr:unnamed protein product [Ceratitis capitata]
MAVTAMINDHSRNITAISCGCATQKAKAKTNCRHQMFGYMQRCMTMQHAATKKDIKKIAAHELCIQKMPTTSSRQSTLDGSFEKLPTLKLLCEEKSIKFDGSGNEMRNAPMLCNRLLNRQKKKQERNAPMVVIRQ